MRHLLSSKTLYHNQNQMPKVKAAQVSLGAAPHTLVVRALELARLANVSPKLQYAELSERNGIFPAKRFAGATHLNEFAGLLRNVVQQLADSKSAQITQPSETGEYLLRYVRCDLTGEMRLLNEALPSFDFDLYTTNFSVKCTGATPREHENTMRLAGLPVRIGRK
jgi:hypothetical protein